MDSRNHTIISFAAVSLLCAVALLAGCERETKVASPVDTLHQTTAGSIVLDNLNADIDHWQAQLASDKPQSLGRLGRLQASLLLRAQVRMRMDDYIAAHAVAERAVADYPNEPAARLLLERSHSAVHRYGKATKALDQAQDMLQGGSASIAAAIATRRCKLERAAGNYDAALRCASDAVTAAPSTSSHGEYATLLAEVGRFDDAQSHFAKAWAAYKQPSPIVPAWLALAQSKALQDASKPKAAAKLLTDMQARMPEHLRLTTETAVALEGTGQRKAAIDMLMPLLDETDDPDVPNLLAGWLADAGDAEAAAAMTARAKKGFEKHLAALPEGYAAHAVELWVGPGDDLPKALALAQANAENSPTVPALSLLADVAHAAGNTALACKAAARLREINPALQPAALSGC